MTLHPIFADILRKPAPIADAEAEVLAIHQAEHVSQPTARVMKQIEAASIANAIDGLRRYKSASAKLAKMIAADLAAYDEGDSLTVFTTREARLTDSLMREAYPDDCAWAGVALADVTGLYHAIASLARETGPVSR